MNQSGKDTANILTTLAATHSKDSKEIEAFVRELTHVEHRTNQQRTMGLIVKVLEAWAAQTSFDARNEATIKLAKKMIDATGDKYDRGLPYI